MEPLLKAFLKKHYSSYLSGCKRNLHDLVKIGIGWLLMGSYKIIEEIGVKLTELIQNKLLNIGIIDPLNDITLSSPDTGKLSLFLYQIVENIHSKNQNILIDNDSNIKHPPLSLSLFYLITAHTGDNSDNNNHLLMGKVLQIIHDNAILRAPLIPDSLNGDELRLILNPLSIDDLNKIWTIISESNPYKISISLEVTPVKIESLRERAVERRVTERDIDYYYHKEDEND